MPKKPVFFEKKKKISRGKWCFRIATSILVMTGTFCLIVGCIPKRSDISTSVSDAPFSSSTDQKTKNSSSDNRTIIWADEANTGEGFVAWNYKWITVRLENALNSDTGAQVYAILASRVADPEFIYKDKSIADYETEMNKERDLPAILSCLMEEGEYLKYGTMLYETGAPDGVTWSKEYYEERVEMYNYHGVLGKYIVNGEFLKDQLKKDYDDAFAKAEKNGGMLSLIEAKEAYITYLAESLSSKYETEVVDVSGTKKMIVYMTKDELLEFEKDDDQELWSFDLATRDAKSHVIASADE